MAKETVGLKLDPEVAGKFKELQAAAGGTAQDFVEILLAAHAERQIETDTASPIYKEQAKVKQALASVERVVGSYLELAAADKIAAEEKARDAIEVAQSQVAELKEEIENDNIIIEDLKTKNEDLVKKVAGLEEKAESIETLKAAWDEKERALNQRVGELDAEAKQARDLAKTVADLEKGLHKKDSALALADQQHKYDRKMIDELKEHTETQAGWVQDHIKDIKEMRVAHKAEKDILKSALDSAKEKISQEKIDCANRVAGIEKVAAKEKGQLSGKLEEVKGQLESLRVLPKKVAGLESQLKDALAENHSLGKELENAQAEIEKLKKPAKK